MANSSYEPAGQDVFDLWLKIYKGTWGKLWEAPPIGPAREKTDKAAKGYAIYAHLIAAWMDALVDFQAVSMEAMRKTQKEALAGVQGPDGPASYKDFYKIFIEAYSDTFKEFLKTEHFSADMGEMNASLIDVQQFGREMLEENYLRPMNLPTKTDLDEINKDVYSLKKAARRAARAGAGAPAEAGIEAVQAELDSLKRTVKKLSGQVKKLSAQK